MSENTENKKQSGPKGPMGMGAPAEKAKDFKGTFNRLLKYLTPHKRNLVIVFIFAIASTTFTIVAPKIASRAMNQLQNAYMAKQMLSNLDEGQTTAVSQMTDKMGDSQTEVVEKVTDKMADGQKTATDKIVKSLGDAQDKAVSKMYKAIAIQLYNGMEDGQEKAVSTLVSKMSATQTKMYPMFVGGIMGKMAAQQAAAAKAAAVKAAAAGGALTAQPTMTPAQIAAAKKAAIKAMTIEAAKVANEKYPLISKASSQKAKIKRTIEFINALLAMPSNKSIDKTALKNAKDLLELPMLKTVATGEKKVKAVKEFTAMAKKMSTSSSTSNSGSFTLTDNMMDKVYATMKTITDFSVKSSDSTSTISKKEKKAVEKLLKLPSVNGIKDQEVKKKTVIKLIDIFADMPSTKSSKINKKDLKTIKELLELPVLDTMKAGSEKTAALIQTIDVFSKMSSMSGDMKTDTNEDVSDPKQLNQIKELIQLKDIKAIKDRSEQLAVLQKMLTIFGDLPETSDDKTKDDDNKFDVKTIDTIKEFLALPQLSTITDANKKAEVSQKIIDLGAQMKKTMSDAPTNAKDNVSYTDEQIDSVMDAIRDTNGEYDFVYIGQIAIILIIMYLISALFSLIMGLVMSGVAQKTVRDLRRDVDEKLARLPLSYYDKNSNGDILSRVTNDVDTISTTLQQSLTQLITSVITIVGYIIMMLSISWVLTLIVIATLPLYVMSTVMVAKKSQKYFGDQQKEMGLISGHVEEMYTGHKIVKVFGHDKDAIVEFEAINGRLNDAGWKAQFVSGIMFPLMNFVSNVGYVGISIVGGIWITKSLLGLGDILAFIQYSRSFTMPIVQTANIANIIQSTIACAERVFQILDEEEEVLESSDAVCLVNPQGSVTFEQVDFSYDPEIPLIQNMNLDVKPGDTVAIVGPTGAGKTTLVNLLMRFYEINKGTIRIDGVDINDMRRSDLRKMFGMVLQETWLYNGTIYDNIAYGREGATPEEVKQAAKAAHADRFIRTLPEGYQTVLNEEGTNISQGQKQLLTIARAILADPAILILDEATSSVDTRTEVLIQKAMANLMKNRTSFVIAHRLSTIRDAESIMVMNQGSIIEMGNHKTLLGQNGFYADLYNSQFTGANLA